MILLKTAILIVALVSVIAPIMVWSQTSGQIVTSGLLTIPDTLLLTFPLLGMLAFAFIWMQAMVGSFLEPLTKIFKPTNMVRYHITQGIFSILLVLLHPALLLVAQFLRTGVGIQLFIPEFIVAEQLPFLLMGEAALLLFLVAVTAALLRNKPVFVRHWRKFHYLNYAVFFLVYFHSTNLGSHIDGFMRNLYHFYFVTVVFGLVYRRVYKEMLLRKRIAELRSQKQMSVSSSQNG